MADDPLQLRLQFLMQAAHLLAVKSPTASANIGAARDKLASMDDRDIDAPKKEWDALRLEVCGACGNTFVPAWTCRISCQTPLAKKEQRRSNPPVKSDKHIVYSCARCDRKTIQPLPSRPPKHVQVKTGGTVAEASPQAVNQDSKITKSANMTSKQRKKARKGGLQAMLEKNKTQNPTAGGLGLDLMDFMQ